MGVFPGGLSSFDLKQLADMKIIPQNWVSLMKEHTQVQSSSTDSKQGQVEPQKQNQGMKLDCQQIIPGHYIWITITKDSAKEFLYYQPAEFLYRLINNKLKAEIAPFNFSKFEYLALVAVSMINRLKEIYEYHEKLIEYSSVNNSGLWKPSEKNSFYTKRMKDKKFYTFIDEFKEGPNAFDRVAIEKMFGMHEQNFKSFFDSETITSLLQFESNLHFLRCFDL